MSGSFGAIAARAARVDRRIGAAMVVAALVAASLIAVAASPAGAAGPAHHLAFNSFPGASPTAGVAWATQPLVTIQDIANATATTSNAPIFLHITPASIDPGEEGATLVCTANPVNAVAGVATFAGCHIDRAGTYTLTAEDPTDGLAAVSAPFTIAAGAASKLAFTTQPGYGTAAEELTTPPAVTVQDAFGNTAATPLPGNAWTITLTLQGGSNPGGGTLSCVAGVPTISFVATFTGCEVSAAGTGYTLLAASSPVLTSATSAPFNVSAGAPTGLAFIAQPGSGAPTPSPLPTFKVAFVDGGGRVVSTADGDITVTVAPGSPAGTLAPLGCTNAQTAASGIATFASCTLSLPGTGYQFRATSTDPTLGPVDSNQFTVGILHLAFLTQPSNGTVNNPLPSQPVVAVMDASNQIVTSSDPIELNIAGGTGTPGATLSCVANPATPQNNVTAFALCEVDLPGVAYRITATSTALGLSVNSALFNVVGPAAKLVFTAQPGFGSAGIPFPTQPIVQIQDAAGNLIDTDNTTVVSLAKTTDTPTSGGPGVLTCAPRTAIGGVATFAGCRISQQGTGYKLTATSNPVLAPADTAAFNVGAPTLHRIFGATAIDTAIEVSNQAFPLDDSAGAVVLARSDFFSDALAGGPLAAAKNAPLLITPGASQAADLDPRVTTEIQRVLATGKVVYILGGTLALASGIDATLSDLGYVPVRVAGVNLFATAVEIALKLGTPSTIFEATGLNFPDALSAVPAAISTGGAILLTNGNQQAPETAAYLAAHPPSTRYAIGGPLAAFGADPTANPVYGNDLYGTSAQVALVFFTNPALIGVATGLNYPDALSGGVFMATGGRMGPVLLVQTHVPLPPPIAVYLTPLPPTPGYVFGGPIAVGDDVVAAIDALV